MEHSSVHFPRVFRPAIDTTRLTATRFHHDPRLLDRTMGCRPTSVSCPLLRKTQHSSFREAYLLVEVVVHLTSSSTAAFYLLLLPVLTQEKCSPKATGDETCESKGPCSLMAVLWASLSPEYACVVRHHLCGGDGSGSASAFIPETA